MAITAPPSSRAVSPHRSLRDAPDAPVLPAPVRRWLARAKPERDAPTRTIYLEGPARFKRGRLPYLPLDIRVWTRLGFDRVSELECRIAGLTIVRGLDAFVDGEGFTQIGSELSAGPEIDQGAFHVMFLETLLVPGAWPAEIRWEAVDAHSARVVTPFADGQETALVTFDPATELPATYRTDRYRAVGEPKIPWTATLGEWQSFGPLYFPSRIDARWAVDPQPWLRMRITHAAANVVMDEPLARARTVLGR